MLSELSFAFLIAAICVVIHTSGMVIVAEWLINKRQAVERRPGLISHTFLLISIFTVIILLHVLSTAIWAMFYFYQGLFADPETALYFSLGSYTTVGYGDVVLPQRWRLLGGVEALSGVLLCGLSAAFIFAIVNGLLRVRAEIRNPVD
jgi:Ion channel